MSEFDFTTLIIDRSQTDVDALNALLKKPMEQWTEEEKAEFNLARSKGAYNYTDLNRVTQCMEYLDETLRAYGYRTGYQRIILHTEGGGSVLPDGYTELEYIQSSGNAYIDTDFKPNQNSRVRMDVEVGSPVAATMCFFGTRNASQPTATLAYNVWAMNTGASIRSDFFSTNASLDFAAASGTRILIDKDKTLCHVNDETITNTQNTGQATLDLFLLACNDTGSPDYYLPAKLYSCQIYDNGLLVRDFVPSQDSTGNVGLYDLVGVQFYGNAGSGAFVAGPEITPEPGEVLDPYTWYESDTPTASQMYRYLQNVSTLRETLTLPAGTDEVPEDMNGLTQAEANNIEKILLAVEDTIRRMERTVDLGWAMGIAHIGLYGSVSA